MKTNYHTHTHRCRHAEPGERQYIDAAVREGFRVLGFADHAPQIFPGDYYSGMRMRPEETEDYVNTLLDLRREYRGEVDIHIGFEAEYYPALFSDLLRHLEPFAYDYLILGQHFLGNEQGDAYTATPTDSVDRLKAFVDQCSEALNTGAFSCFAHPDILCFEGDEAVYRRHVRALCREAKACAVPLELNLLGLATGRNYPRPAFWEEAAAVGCKAIIGWDAHSPDWFAQPTLLERAESFLDSLGIRRIEFLTLVRPHAS